ncbi:DUF3085 domain-containing protein [Halomonas casei]|uniref:DUF3085 domain-containing protein n=1 Tax=Halomonas casei TaxID=2742613 RepID=UPI003CF07B2E
MATLSFKISDIKNMAEHARAAKEHRACLDQHFDENLWKEEFKKRKVSDDEVFSELNGSHLDGDKIPAGFWLVKDQGVYLMSNGLPVDKAPDGKGMNISHAKGLKPGVDVDWYDAARRALGGDDMVCFIPLEWYDLSVEKGKRTLSIRVNKNSMSLVL